MPLRPFLRRWARDSTAAARDARRDPAPRDSTERGPDPDRVLLVGSGPVAGLGAAGTAPPLAAALASAIAARTGRGATVEAHGAPHATVVEVPAMLAAARVERFDAVVVVVGMADAAAGLPMRQWRRSLATVIGEVQRAAPRGGVVLLTRIPPATATAIYRGSRALLADLRIRAFNRAIDRFAHEGTGIGASEIARPLPGVALGGADWYRSCAERLATDLAPLLDAARAG